MRALLLDLDGTLADSLAVLRDAYREFLADFGIEGTEAEFERLNGPPLADVVAILQRTHELPGSIDDLYAQYMTRLHDTHGITPPASGARAVLEQARTGGWRIAVVTSATRAAVDTWLRAQDLDGLVDAVVGGDEVANAKPHPEPYRAALELLDCDADASLAVEDSEHGASSALAAGVPTLLIGATVPATIADAPRFRGTIATFADLAAAL